MAARLSNGHESRVELSDLLSIRFAPIQERLLPLLDTADIIALTKTSKKFSKMNASLRAKEYNINVQLKRWFSDPVAFRSVQAKCDTLIIGGFALRFFECTTTLPNSLHLYVGQDYPAMVRHLEAEGYSKVSQEISGEYKKTGTDGEVRCVFTTYIDADSQSPILLLLKTAPTTVGLQLIAWNKAYRLYPQLTFIANELFDLHARPNGEYT